MLMIKPTGLSDEFVVGYKKRQELRMLLTETGRTWGNQRALSETWCIKKCIRLQEEVLSRLQLGERLELG